MAHRAHCAGTDGRPVDRFEAYQEKRRAEPLDGPADFLLQPAETWITS